MRRRLIGLGLLVVLCAGAAVVFARGGDDPAATRGTPSARPSGSAAELAAAACVLLRLVEQGIRADSSAVSVRENLAQARTLAADASRQDPRWVALSGGMAALDEAVARDDAAAAGIGLRVARQECRGVRG